MSFPILSTMILLPVVAAFVTIFLNANAARWTALATTVALFVLGIMLWQAYDIGGPQWQFVEQAPIFGQRFSCLELDHFSPRDYIEALHIAVDCGLQVVVVDSLRADMLNNINMPNLQRYADQHLNFANHMSGGNDDAMGMFSLFYGLPGHYYGDIRADKRPPVLFDEMLRQDYQFGLFGALEDAQQYQQSLLAGLRKQVFVSRQSDDTRLIGDWQQWLHQVVWRPSVY